MSNKSINLLNLNFSELKNLIKSFEAYRADQIIQWIHQRGITDFDQMSNLSKNLRHFLKENAYLAFPKIIKQQISKDGTIKWLLELEDKKQIEMVYIPETSRGTLCISSQVGCPLACTFCATGSMGFQRNLTLGEIVGQVWIAIQQLHPLRMSDQRLALAENQKTKDISPKQFKEHRNITNIVFMGMGEPLLNMDPVTDAAFLFTHDLAYNFSRYRVTISTIGLIEPLKKLKEKTNCALAISLHAPTDELRHALMPATKSYTLKELMQICKNYFSSNQKRKITFEYLLLREINDQPKHAKALIQLLSSIPCKVNLIIFNPFEKSLYRSPDPNVVYQSQLNFRGLAQIDPSILVSRRGGEEQTTGVYTQYMTVVSNDANEAEKQKTKGIEHFQRILMAAGINTRVRKSRGQDIAAACGQLAIAANEKIYRKDTI